jgi:hypothetical protein
MYLLCGLLLGLFAIAMVCLVGAGSLASAAAWGILVLVAFGVLFVSTMVSLVFQWRAAMLLQQAERQLYAGDLCAAAENCQSALRTVSRGVFRMKALYVLALVAERSGASLHARTLFEATVTAMWLRGASGRRALAHIHAHLVFAHADSANWEGAFRALAQCHRELSGGIFAPGRRRTVIAGGRDPRPLAALAGAYLALRTGNPRAAYAVLTEDQSRLVHELNESERALFAQTLQQAGHALAAQGPMRAPCSN